MVTLLKRGAPPAFLVGFLVGDIVGKVEGCALVGLEEGEVVGGRVGNDVGEFGTGAGVG